MYTNQGTVLRDAYQAGKMRLASNVAATSNSCPCIVCTDLEFVPSLVAPEDHLAHSVANPLAQLHELGVIGQVIQPPRCLHELLIPENIGKTVQSIG